MLLKNFIFLVLLYYEKKHWKTNTAGKQICMYCLLDFFYAFFKGRSKNKKIYGSIFQSVTDIGFARKKNWTTESSLSSSVLHLLELQDMLYRFYVCFGDYLNYTYILCSCTRSSHFFQFLPNLLKWFIHDDEKYKNGNVLYIQWRMGSSNVGVPCGG